MVAFFVVRVSVTALVPTAVGGGLEVRRGWGEDGPADVAADDAEPEVRVGLADGWRLYVNECG